MPARRLSEYHAKFPGGIRWRLTSEGVELEAIGLLKFDVRMYEIAVPFLREYATDFAGASQEYKVPVELLMACALTQSPDGPKKFVWRSPGYVGDTITPDLISAGIYRMQLSTAQRCMKDPTLDHNCLLDVRNASRVCAAGLRFDFITLRTRWDPILVACAFNAGGLFEDPMPDNPWRLKTYSMRLGFPPTKLAMVRDPLYPDLFARHFSAARQLVDAGLLGERQFVGFREAL